MRWLRFKNVDEGEFTPEAYLWCGFGYVGGRLDSFKVAFTTPWKHTERHVSPRDFQYHDGEGRTTYVWMLRYSRPKRGAKRRFSFWSTVVFSPVESVAR